MLRNVGRSLRIGPRLLRMRRAYQFGPRVEIETLLARRRYLKGVQLLAPLPSGSGPFDCFMLLNEPRVFEGIWSLYSFRLHAGPCRMTVLSDGTLTEKSVRLIRSLFPGIVVPDAAVNDEESLADLSRAGLRRCAAWRAEFVLFRKAIDPFRLAQSERVVLLDSDCLHFRRPEELYSWVSSPSPVRFAADINPHSFCVTPAEFEHIAGAPAPAFFNTGYVFFLRDAIDFQRIEHYLSHPCFERQLSSARFAHVAEQTLLAMEAARAGAQVLQPHYAICPDVPSEDVVMGHFCGGQPSRNWFYTKGLPTVEAHVRRAAGARAGA